MTPPQAQRDGSYYARHLARVTETTEMNANDEQIQGYRDIQKCIRNSIGVITGRTDQSSQNLENGTEQAINGAAAHDLTQIADILMKLSERRPPGQVRQDNSL